MIGADRPIWRSWAVLGTPIAMILALALARASEVFSPFSYPLARQAAASVAILAVGPFVALVSAWEARVLLAVWGRLPVHRSWMRVVAGRVTPQVLTGCGIMTVVYVERLRDDLLHSSTTLAFYAISIAAVLAWSVVGAALGLWLPTVIALPAALVAPYLAMTYPASWTPLWLRHLTGVLFDCCSSSDRVSPAAVLASLLMMGALIGLSLAALEVRLGPSKPRLDRVALMVVATVSLAVAGVSSARALGALPTEARPASELVCERNVCVWPEELGVIDANSRAWLEVQGALFALEVDLGATRIAPIAASGMLPMVVSTTDRQVAMVAMTLNFASLVDRCFDSETAEIRFGAAEQLTRLLAAELGVTEEVGFDEGTADTRTASELYALLTQCAQ